MSEKQKTLKNPVSLSGRGLHTGANVTVSIKPVPANHGILFKRVDLPEQPVIEPLAENVTDTSRGTTIQKDGVSISTIEHLMAALSGLKIDNALVEINAPEIPILDGSSRFFLEEILKAGITDLDEDRVFFELTEKIVYEEPQTGSKIIAYPDDDFNVDVMISYPSKILNNQFASYQASQDFVKEIGTCRTFVFLNEVEPLLKNNLIKGGDLDNAIVIIDREFTQEEFDRLADLFNKPKIKVKPEGILNNIDLYHENEPARHKLLDVVGDLSLIGMPIKARIIATKPGHGVNTGFAKLIRKMIKANKQKMPIPKYDPNEPPLFDTMEVQRRIPHRPPFLLVDKILFMDKWKVVGIKNVTMNEAFFVGHFPDEPIMPGVLQIEAMAQVGAILLTSFVEDPDNYLTYFLKIENIKFKQKVSPGDTLIITMILTEPIKRGIAITKGYAYIGNKLVIEGEFMAQLVKKPSN